MDKYLDLSVLLSKYIANIDIKNRLLVELFFHNLRTLITVISRKKSYPNKIRSNF